MNEGLDGIVDFVGYSVAQPENIPEPPQPVGCIGFLDFTCIPVACPVPRAAGTNIAAGRRHVIAQAWAEAYRERSLIDNRNRMLETIMRARIRQRQAEYTEAVATQKAVFERNVNAVLLSEV